MTQSVLARISLAAALVLVSIAGVGTAVEAAPQQDKKLKLGDAAPPLDGITDWVQGEKPNLNVGVHVIEFWATWCGPCRRAIPHLNRIYRKYQSPAFSVVGVAADERGTAMQENVTGVRNFVKQQGAAMSYRVAVDTAQDAKRRYMEAAGRSGIPCTFVIGRGGRVLWIGNPHDDRFEKIVDLAIANKYDPILTPKGFEALEAAKRAANLRNWREAYMHLDKGVEVDPPLFGWLIVERYVMTLEQEKNEAEAKAYLRRMFPGIATDPYSLGIVVDALCKDPRISTRDLDSAMVFAEQMKRASGAMQAPGLAAVALVHATRGELDQAVEVQTTAFLGAPVDEKPEMKRRLDEYQRMKARRDQAKLFSE
ncbi:MAG: TlpA family protein disulfide reductase [Phycisphaeraceae bacterium]|nr:TlpA family protein disulfide reductase [Phycisphaeraceae bacterium]